MSLNFAQARDEVLTLFRTYWVANAPSNPPLYWWDQVADQPADPTWARIIMRHSSGGNDAIGNRLRVRRGTVFVQIFTIFGDGLSTADQLAKVAADAFHGKATDGGVWFRNVRLTEVGQEGRWFQNNVLADFEYNEVV